jgi:hypothetical protein
VWLSNAAFSQKHVCESGKHFKTIWCLWPLENWTCSNFNSSYNYIKNICFELSFLTFISVLYTKTGCSIGLWVNTCNQNNHHVPISMVMHLQISGNIYIIVMLCGNKTENWPWQLMDSLLMELWSFCTTLSSLHICTEFRSKTILMFTTNVNNYIVFRLSKLKIDKYMV